MLWSSASVVTRLQSRKLRGGWARQTDTRCYRDHSKASSQGDKFVLLEVAGKSDLRVPGGLKVLKDRLLCYINSRSNFLK